jgi:hypothetical protein
MQIVELAASLGETLTSLSVQNTTLDDVFIHYTGPPAARRAGEAGIHHAAAAGSAAMNRMFAIIEREMRKFFRSPTLMIMSLMMPILQLIIIGNAFGGKIVGTHVAVVDYDHGPQAVKVREAFDAVAANIKTFSTIEYTQRGAGARRCAHRQNRRRSDHSRAILAPRLRAGRAQARFRRR